MLVLISFGLVLVATVLLVLGLLVGDGLALIYVSIACSLAAGVVLVVATRMARPQTQAAGGPAPLEEPTAAAPAVTPGRTSERAAERDREPTAVAAVADDVAMAPAAPTTAETPAVTVADEAHEADVEEGDEEFFPIADYDDLTVSEIMPLLPQLYADELDVVEDREREGKSRVTILNRIAELREQLRGAPADVTAAELEAAGQDEWGIPEEGWDEPEDEAAEEEVTGDLPIAGYDDLTVPEVTDRLADLSDDELEDVRRHEEDTKGRKGVLRAIDDLLESAAAATAAKKTAKKAAGKKAPAKKPAGKKAAAKKAPAKKAAAKKKAPAKKTSRKKTAAKKSARKR